MKGDWWNLVVVVVCAATLFSFALLGMLWVLSVLFP